ncbi:MAG: hypothetical protein U9Q95_04100, partial [Candidatus Eisenbacteria bacterium]|nr:hypothetical protein [Candidatus Eisenbacteria bacterium]
RSKLHAQRWLHRTALPELLGLPPSKFNNTRVHRVLAALDRVDAALQEHLARRYAAHEGAFVALFMDVTDTWFVGHGPHLAEWNKTKEGFYRRRINIALLCNERGYPLRWQVLPGKQQDGQIMSEMAAALQNVGWMGEAPLVCDRAMGKGVYLEALADSGLRFVTALPVDEYDTYTTRIPHGALADVALRGDEASLEDDVQRAGDVAEQAGMRRISKTLYVLDLDVVEKQSSPPPVSKRFGDSVAQRLRLGQTMKEELDRGIATSLADLGRRHGCEKSVANAHVQLLNLTPDIQQAILVGQAEALSYTTLRKIRRLPTPQQQRVAFDDALAKASLRPRRTPAATATAGTVARRARGEPLSVRGVAYFNPEMFVGQRLRADEKLAAVHTFVRDLNERLASPHSRRDEASVYGEVAQRLRRDDLTDVFDVELQTHSIDGRDRFRVSIQLNHKEWRRRRRYDGFSFLVAHPGLSHSAEDLVALYHAKDAVEKDFQTIKSVVKLRPTRHRTDPKVRAHVTLCMLALLLERTVEHRLSEAGMHRTAPEVFEELASCHLNELAVREAVTPTYSVTEDTPEQRRIVEALRLSPLLDDEEVAATLSPR